MSPTEALAAARTRLSALPDPLRDARRLLAHAAGLEAGQLHRLDETLPPDLAERFDALVTRRAEGEPLARILGYREFWKHRFEITGDVLDPRADTETLVALALEARWDSVLDLGTGSGCILLSLLAERPGARGTGTDLSDKALEVARRNAGALGVADRAALVRADWWDGVEGAFDLIVSNPPYISDDEMRGLSPEVLQHDPHMALTPGGDGLAPYRIIAARAGQYLRPEGHLMVEVGWRQGPEVMQIFDDAGLAEPRIHADLEKRDRVVTARRG